MSTKVQAVLLTVVLLTVGLGYYLLNVVLAVRRHFKGTGMSPGTLGASIPLLVVLFVQPWPLWLRLALAPAVVLLEFSWIGIYFLLERLRPRNGAPPNPPLQRT
jgi:hypothetical protein